MPTRGMRRSIRWLLVVVTLVGLCGQLALTCGARPEETPRQAIPRLTRIDITAAPLPDHRVSHPPMSAHMPMPHMSMPMGHDTHPKLARAQSSGESDIGHHHHNDGSCPLCPLLHLPAIVLVAVILVLLATRLRSVVRPKGNALRAPPVIRFGVAPPRGPPLMPALR